MGNMVLNASTNSYTIMGLTPSTNYIITMFAINQCGNGPLNTVDVATENNLMPSQTTSNNPSEPTPNPSGPTPKPSMYVNYVLHKINMW